MKKNQSLLQVYGSRKMVALLLLGFSSGLPYALTDDAFRAWMTKANLDLKTIGWLGLVSLPYSFKFIWSPLLDRFVPPFLGRRRGWMLLTQMGLIVAILALAIQMAVISNSPSPKTPQSLLILGLIAIIVAFLSASQDISIDAYRTDVLNQSEVGAGVGVWVTGYRIALLLTGWIGFNLADRFSQSSSVGWAWVYGLMAVFMLFGLITSLWTPEPKKNERPPSTLPEAIIQPFAEFNRRLGWRRALFVLIFIILYKLGDSMVAKMAVPFLGGKGLGFSDTDIGNIRQGMGLVATIVGTLTGGAILGKIGINRSLWVFGILQAVSNLGYYLLAVVGKNYPAMVLAINIENFSGGLGTSGFIGFMMSLCNPRFSATQFALLSSLMAVGRDVFATPFSGELAQKLQQIVPVNDAIKSIPYLAGIDAKGWPLFFLATLVAGLPGLVLLPFFAPWKQQLTTIPRPGLNDEEA
jgi:PAT family beta-lactamase induction signal transducer AmpG